jgi:hypothetical protein
MATRYVFMDAKAVLQYRRRSAQLEAEIAKLSSMDAGSPWNP